MVIIGSLYAAALVGIVCAYNDNNNIDPAATSKAEGIVLDTLLLMQEEQTICQVAKLSKYCTYAEFTTNSPKFFSDVMHGKVSVYKVDGDNQVKGVRLLTLAWRRLYSIDTSRGTVYVVYDGSSYAQVGKCSFGKKCGEWLKLGGVENLEDMARYYCTELTFTTVNEEAPIALQRLAPLNGGQCDLTLDESIRKAHENAPKENQLTSGVLHRNGSDGYPGN